jgi:hypothetical protein
VLQDVFDLTDRDLGIVLSHPDRDVAEVTADVVQPGAVGQQPGGQGVPGLVGDVAGAEVELVDPVPEPVLEGSVGDRVAAVEVADVRGEQSHPRPLIRRWRAAVPGGEPGRVLCWCSAIR